MSRSSIEWTQATWNPIVGCSIVSPGCTNCYAMKMAARIEGMNAEAYVAGRKPTAPHYDGTTHNVNGNNVWTGKLARASERTLLEPLRTRKPTLYFVNSMSDLFHEDVPDAWIDQAFAVMVLSPQHTFQVLTKRARRMREYMERRMLIICDAMGYLLEEQKLNKQFLDRNNPNQWIDGSAKCAQFPWPLPNVWLGVSTERQKEADERIPALLDTPAAVRFISAEPLVGPMNLTSINHRGVVGGHSALHDRGLGKLDWVIVGGESGPGSRPMHPDWARALRDQCLAAGVPFFFKQWGAYLPFGQRSIEYPRGKDVITTGTAYDQHSYIRVGKKAAGRLLDGMLHDEMPGAFEGRRAIVDQLEGAAP